MRETKIYYLENELIIEESNSIHCIQYNEISHIIYDNFFTIIHTNSDEEVWICCSLKKMIKKLLVMFFYVVEILL